MANCNNTAIVKAFAKRYAFIILMAIMLLPIISAFSTTTFNNSLNNETILFNGVDNVTRYLAVPQSTNTLINGYMNISGFQSDSLNTLLVAYYNFSETGTTATSSVAGGPVGNADGSAIWTTNGFIGKGINATATGGLALHYGADGFNYEKTQAFSYSLWFKTTYTGANNYIIWKGGAGEPYAGRYVAVEDGSRLRFNLINDNGGGSYIGAGSITNLSYSDDKWHHFVGTYDGSSLNTGMTIYVDGVDKTGTRGGTLTGSIQSANDFTFGARTTAYFDGVLDEFAVWNRTLTSAEVLVLYNNGAGQTYPLSTPLENSTLSIGGNSIGIPASNGTTPVTIRTSNLASYINSYLSGCTIQNGYCNVPFIFSSPQSGNLTYSNMTFDNIGFTENNQTYNASTYETASESFSLNLTYDTSNSISANLIYAGTSYAGTQTISGNNSIFTTSFDVSGVSNNTFYWDVNVAGTHFNSTSHTQNASAINLALCNATYTVPYVNFTFIDESTGLYMNASTDLATWTYWLGSGTATKTYIFTNTTHNLNYPYCFSPADRPMKTSLAYQYSDTGYPQRTYAGTTTYTNSTTVKPLYLLGTSVGREILFIVQNVIGNAPISGVTIQAERQFSGVWTQVGLQTTDSAGSATFFLNPNYDHRITVTKTGYPTQSLIVRPTASPQTITMGASAVVTNYTFIGIKWNAGPKNFVIDPGTTTTFWFNVTAAQGNLVKCKFELRTAENGTLLYTMEGTATNSGAKCIATGSYLSPATCAYQYYGYYYLDLGSGYGLLKAKDPWICENMTTNGNYNLFDVFKNFGELPDFGSTHNRQEFSKIVAFFFIMIMLIGGFTFFTGYDFAQPGAGLILLWGFILLASFAGIFTIAGLSVFAWFDKYAIAMITSFITWGFLLDHWRRSSQ